MGRAKSQIPREADREQDLGKQEQRRKAMQAFVGACRDFAGAADSTEYVRSLRKGSRQERIFKSP
jgi:hypothetical protein